MVNRNLCTENKQFFKKNETPARIYLTSNNNGTKTYIYFRKYLLKN